MESQTESKSTVHTEIHHKHQILETTTPTTMPSMMVTKMRMEMESWTLVKPTQLEEKTLGTKIMMASKIGKRTSLVLLSLIHI